MTECLAVTPPACEQIESFSVYQGQRVRDEYSWLEDRNDPKVLDYLHAEVEYAQSCLRSSNILAEHLYKEFLLAHEPQSASTHSVPKISGQYEYFSRSVPGEQYPIQCRRARHESAREEVVLDLNGFASESGYVNIRGYAVSPDETKVAYCLDLTGARRYRLLVKDLRAGSVADTGIVGVGEIEWAGDSDSIFLVLEDNATKRHHQVFRYDVATAALQLLYRELDPLFAVGISSTRDGAYLLITSESTTTSEIRCVSNVNRTGATHLILPRSEGHRYYADHHEGWFILRSNKDRPEFNLFRCSVRECSVDAWEFLYSGGTDASIDSHEVFSDFVVLFVSQGCARQLVRLSLRDHSTKVFAGADIGTIFPGQNRNYNTATYLYKYQDFVTPPTLVEADLREFTLRTVAQQARNADPDRYEVQRLWIPARDGSKVPVSLIRKKTPTFCPQYLLIHVYGAYGANSHVLFDPSRFSLVDRGVTVAIAHVRGGGDLGPRWHSEGRRRHKENTVNDLEDVVNHLIDLGLTAHGKVLLYGASAAGVAIGSVINRCPQAFAAVYMNAPFVDIVKTMSNNRLPLTGREYLEWGNPADPDDREVMRACCPYEQIRPQIYPPILITASLNDSQVMFWEAAKYVARLRKEQAGGSPILLWMRMEAAGHGGKSGKYDLLRERASVYAWLLEQCQCAD